LNKTSNLLTTPFFTTNLISINLGLRKDYSTLDSFVVLFCTSGEGYVEAMEHKVPIKASEVILLPAICQEANIIPKGLLEVLEVFIV
jgi:mannose-6-phosphate isomerase